MKAREFPNDTRNLKAAEELECLAAEISALDGSEIHHEILELIDRLGDACEASDSYEIWTDLKQEVSRFLRGIGFHRTATASEFLEWYRDLLQESAAGLA
jgi:hypothetical protein